MNNYYSHVKKPWAIWSNHFFQSTLIKIPFGVMLLRFWNSQSNINSIFYCVIIPLNFLRFFLWLIFRDEKILWWVYLEQILRFHNEILLYIENLLKFYCKIPIHNIKDQVDRIEESEKVKQAPIIHQIFLLLAIFLPNSKSFNFRINNTLINLPINYK